MVLASLATAALSFSMECLQSYLPLRVASNVDLGFNTLGGLLGALGAALLDRLGAIEHGRRVRRRWFARDARGAQRRSQPHHSETLLITGMRSRATPSRSL